MRVGPYICERLTYICEGSNLCGFIYTRVMNDSRGELSVSKRTYCGWGWCTVELLFHRRARGVGVVISGMGVDISGRCE